MLIDYGLSNDARSTGYKAGILEAAFAFANGIGIIVSQQYRLSIKLK